jgi:uncharacterized protein with FMN-binding domain
MPPDGSKKKVANSLLALSSAAVLGVYSAGYVRTKAAADRFAIQSDVRRPARLPDRAAAPASAPTVAATTSPRPPAAAVPAARGARSQPTTQGASRNGRGVQPPPPGIAADRAARRAANRALIASILGSGVVPAESAPAPSAAQTPEAPAAGVPAVAPSPAPEPAAAALPEAAPAPRYKDGTYYGWGTSRHGDIQAQVVIANGRIASATISECDTRYPCSVISLLPPQVAQRQSPEVDYVSGATQSTNAFYYAVVEALGKAR